MKEPKAKRPTFPIILSAFVFPGAGQLMQRRWVAAGAFAIVFTVGFAGFLFYAFRVIAAFYAMAFDFDHNPPEDLSFRPAGIFFGCTILVYIVNVVDAYQAYRRSTLTRRT